jgi:8-oxo-dGTP pyrophosphatase MutT (NUDIX family)
MREASVMLIIKDGLILSVSRKYDQSKYGLAGGKVEPGESPGMAAVRETFEETGIKVADCIWIYKRVEPPDRPDGESFNAYAYYAVDWSGTPVASEEGVVKWLTVKELTETHGAFPDYNRDTLNAFHKAFPNIKLFGK